MIEKSGRQRLMEKKIETPGWNLSTFEQCTTRLHEIVYNDNVATFHNTFGVVKQIVSKDKRI